MALLLLASNLQAATQSSYPVKDPVAAADKALITDATAANATKQTPMSAIAAYAATVYAAYTIKTTPVDGDYAFIFDGTAGRRATLSSFPVSTATQTALNLKADTTALTAKANVSCFDSSANFNSCFTLDWPTATGGGGAVSDDPYSSSWDTIADVSPSKNVVYDKIESMISDLVYGSGWDNNNAAPSKNTVYDKIESMISDLVYGSGWDNNNAAPSKNSIYDKIELMMTAFTPSNAVYGIGWDNSLLSASQNAIYDKIQTMTPSDAVYGPSWNDSTLAASQNAIYDKIETLGAGGSMTWPAAAGLAYYNGSSAWGTSYPVVTTIGTPGVDTNIPSEKAVRDAIAAGGGSSSIIIETTPTAGENKVPASSYVLNFDLDGDGRIDIVGDHDKNTIINLDSTPENDDSWSGPTIKGTLGEVVAQWDLLYARNVSGVLKWYKYDADITTYKYYAPRAVALAAGAANEVVIFGVGNGIGRNAGWAFANNSSEGLDVYAATTAGAITTTAPASAGNQVARVGYMLEENVILFSLGNVTLIQR